MRKLISVLLLGIMCSSVFAEECRDYIDEKGFLGRKCVRDEYDKAGLAWSPKDSNGNLKQSYTIRKHGSDTIIESTRTNEKIICTPDGHGVRCEHHNY